MEASFKISLILLFGLFCCQPMIAQTDGDNSEIASNDSIKPSEEDYSPGIAENGKRIPGIDEFTIVDQEPIPLNMGQVKKMIGYPPEARKNEIEGKVIVKVLLDDRGKYLKHKVIKSSDPVLSEAVEERIPDLKFKPAVLNGETLFTWVTIPFEFRLK